MNRKKVTAAVEELALPLVEELNLELVDIEYVKEGGRWYLRLFIDKPNGVTLDDCQKLSRKLDVLLDKADPVPHSYVLEVSSPGLERPLKKKADFERFCGRLISVKTFVSINNKKQFTGRLLNTDGQTVVMDVEGVKVAIPMEQMASARLVIENFHY